MEHIFSNDFYQEFIANWPKKRYLEPPREVAKSYNTGFGWIHDYSSTPDFSNCDPYGQYPLLLSLLNYLRSPEVSSRVTAFAGTQEELVLHSFILTDAGAGAELYRIKTAQSDPRAKYLLNFISSLTRRVGRIRALTLATMSSKILCLSLRASKYLPRLRYSRDFYHGFPNRFGQVETCRYGSILPKKLC